MTGRRGLSGTLTALALTVPVVLALALAPVSPTRDLRGSLGKALKIDARAERVESLRAALPAPVAAVHSAAPRTAPR
jgi:hypothetical protein